MRQLAPRDLERFDCVMHFAAISNDPMGDLDPEITRDINARGSIALARTAKAAGVARFLLSSSCSIYGKAEDRPLTEEDALNPVSVYAESKIVAEEGIAPLADDSFSPAFLRNSTAYGDSPMLRIDLVVNNLLGCAVAKGDIRIMSDGTPWRPLIHCKDIARAFVAFLEAPCAVIHNQSVNVGGDVEDYQVRDIADIVRHLVPGASIVYTGEVGKTRATIVSLLASSPGYYRISGSNIRWRLAWRGCSHSFTIIASRPPISTATSSSGCAPCAIASTD